MKREWIERIQDFLVILMNHAVVVAIAITIMAIFGKQQPQIVLWISLAILPGFLYVVRKKVKNIFLFYGIHFMLLIGMVYFQAEQLTKVLFIAIMLFYLLWSVRLKMLSKTGKEGLLPAPFFIVLTGILVLLNGAQGNDGWEIYYLLLTFGYLLGYFFYFYMEKYLQFVTINEKSASNIPEKSIFYAGMTQTVLFSSGSLLALILMANLDWFSKMMSRVGDWILNILRAIFAGIEFYVENEPEKALPEDIAQSPGGFHGDLIPEFVLVFIEKLVTVLAYVVVVAVAVAAIWAFYRFLKENFVIFQKRNTRKLIENDDIREACDVKRNHKKRGRRILFGDNREKIRKLYQKHILKRKDVLIGNVEQKQLEYLTAKECCDKLNAEQLKKVYEKARYSIEEVTQEDVKIAKM